MLTDATLADARRRVARKVADVLDIVDCSRRHNDLAWALMPRLGRLAAVRYAIVHSEGELSIESFRAMLEAAAVARAIRREYPRAFREIERLLGPV